ncbi:MAG TPA: DUF1918 domain-containing protein [Streptosporangiaceae bacterium]|jgi:hypothetical protein|nr:DUF1918 domain-containing protein [Streptosporangiaceae bacterium]
MQAAVRDRLHVRGNMVGQPERTGEIVEVRGAGGEPPYLVRFDAGHTSLVFPGPDVSRTVRRMIARWKAAALAIGLADGNRDSALSEADQACRRPWPGKSPAFAPPSCAVKSGVDHEGVRSGQPSPGPLPMRPGSGRDGLPHRQRAGKWTRRCLGLGGS